jgi:hypothetical protein
VKIGDKLEAKWSESLADHVTKGEVYEVVEVIEINSRSSYFKIINDKGKKVMPISTSFRILHQ